MKRTHEQMDRDQEGRLSEAENNLSSSSNKEGQPENQSMGNPILDQALAFLSNPANRDLRLQFQNELENRYLPRLESKHRHQNRLNDELFHACIAGDYDAITPLLEAGADIEAFVKDSDIYDSKDGAQITRQKLSRELSDFNGDVQSIIKGCTPLGLAIVFGHTNIIKLLLDKGASLKCYYDDDDGYPAFIHVLDWYGGRLLEPSKVLKLVLMHCFDNFYRPDEECDNYNKAILYAAASLGKVCYDSNLLQHIISREEIAERSKEDDYRYAQLILFSGFTVNDTLFENIRNILNLSEKEFNHFFNIMEPRRERFYSEPGRAALKKEFRIDWEYESNKEFHKLLRQTNAPRHVAQVLLQSEGRPTDMSEDPLTLVFDHLSINEIKTILCTAKHAGTRDVNYSFSMPKDIPYQRPGKLYFQTKLSLMERAPSIFEEALERFNAELENVREKAAAKAAKEEGFWQEAVGQALALPAPHALTPPPQPGQWAQHVQAQGHGGAQPGQRQQHVQNQEDSELQHWFNGM
ncbi:MAG: Ankyrin repeat (3 copies) [Rickettsiales bacterium]|jgi:hypothetical protein|nr:Ankyrin repeat (3 copies) [Rickettsiales bacterium]